MSALFASGRDGRSWTPMERDMTWRIGSRCRAGLAAFKGDRRGDVAMMFGLMAVVMMLAIGGAVDIGRWLHARQQTIYAMDAAVLAGGRALQLDTKDVNGAKAAAQRFYVENTKTRLALKSDTIQFTPADNNTAFTATGNAYISTPLLSLASIQQLPLLNTTGTDYSKAALAVGGNAELNLEISLMLDTSGSMSGTKIRDLKDAAEDLINIVVWEDQSQYTSKVAIAPFSADMRLPASIRDAARGTGHLRLKPVSYPCRNNQGQWTICTRDYHLTDCVAERPGNNRYTDVAPGPGNYVLPVYAAAPANGNSASCSQPAADEAMALTNNKQQLIAKVQGMPVGGGTAGHLGTAWAWYFLAPNWASAFTAESAPAAYGTPNLQKIAILMTDGEYNTQYDSQGIRTGSTGAGAAVNGSSIVQAKALCDGMKARGITVYTVGFDLGGNQTAINTLNYCATTPGHFYNAVDGEQLKQAFRDIALKISSLYLAK